MVIRNLKDSVDYSHTGVIILCCRLVLSIFFSLVQWIELQHVYPALHWLVFTLYSNKQLWNKNIHQFLSSLHLGLHLYPFIEMEHLKPKLRHLTNIPLLCEAVGIRKGQTCRMVHTTAALLADSTSLSTGKILFLWDVWFSQTAVAQGKSWLQCMHFCMQEDLD